MTNSERERIKQETLALYAQLPDDQEGREARIDIRDKVIELNYAFFGYVANTTFINNPSVTYEDKFQSALCAFCQMWWKYMWAPRFRTDLSFGVFFKPRIGEMIERELNEVKYSIRRSLCMLVGDQLGKHWGRVTYEDLSNPELKLSIQDMNSLKAIFGSLYIADFNTHGLYIEAPEPTRDVSFYHTDSYDTIEELLVQEMVNIEESLELSDLERISDMYCIPLEDLKASYPKAKQMLYEQLKKNLI